MINKYFNNKTMKWENKNIDYKPAEYEEDSITNTSTYKPTLDSIRQAMKTGKTAISGLYEYTKDGEKKDNSERLWDEWNRPDLIDVDNYIKSEQEKNRKKREEARYKRQAEKYSKKLEEQEEKDKKRIIEIIHEAIEKGKK